MRKADFTNVDEYISAQPETAQVVLQRVRSTLRKALRAEEVISYKTPAYRLNGGIVLYFAGWKQHYSLYPDRGLWSVNAPSGDCGRVADKARIHKNIIAKLCAANLYKRN